MVISMLAEMPSSMKRAVMSIALLVVLLATQTPAQADMTATGVSIGGGDTLTMQ